MGVRLRYRPLLKARNVIGNLMKKTQLIIIGLFLNSLFSCSESPKQKKKIKKVESINKISVQIKTPPKETYKIDTNNILTNKNLESLIRIIKKSELKEIKTVNEIPFFIKNFLNSITSDFSIANPEEDWNISCDEDEQLPSRQLVYFGIGSNIVLMTYFTGGFGKSEHILIIKFNKTKIVDFWCGSSLKDLYNKNEILNYIKINKYKKMGLNSNIINL